MDYGRAKDIRQQGLFSLMTDRLSSGQGTGSSIKSAISDRTQATFTGIKEKFDPMNIAKVMTGGSKFAPALVGALMGRSKEDILHFTGKKRNKKLKGLSLKSSGGSESMAEVLGLIYRLMLRIEDDRKKELEERITKDKEDDDEDEQRNQALITALTGRKKRKPSKKATEQKKELDKKTEKEKKKVPETKDKGEPKKPPTPKEEPTIQPPKPTPTAPNVTTKTPTSTSSAIPKPSTIATAAKVPSKAGQILGAAAVGTAAALGSASQVIAKEEGVATKGYWDPPGQKNLVSIGFGHQIQSAEYQQGFIQAGDEQIPIKGNKGIDTTMSKDQAQKLLAVDLPKYEKRASAPLGDSWNKLNENQKTALISYTYNTGSTQSLVKAGLKQAIDSGDMKLAANIIRDKGIKTAGGQYNKTLDERRHREAAIFESSAEPEKKATNIPPVNTSNKLETSSKENKNLKRDMEQSAVVQKSVNTTNINSKTLSNNTPQKEDDTNPYFAKAEII